MRSPEENYGVVSFQEYALKLFLHRDEISFGIKRCLKIESTIRKARAALSITEKFGPLGSSVWRFVDGIPIQNKWNTLTEIPPTTAQSDAMSKDLIRRGFNFVG